MTPINLNKDWIDFNSDTSENLSFFEWLEMMVETLDFTRIQYPQHWDEEYEEYLTELRQVYEAENALVIEQARRLMKDR